MTVLSISRSFVLFQIHVSLFSIELRILFSIELWILGYWLKKQRGKSKQFFSEKLKLRGVDLQYPMVWDSQAEEFPIKLIQKFPIKLIQNGKMLGTPVSAYAKLFC